MGATSVYITTYSTHSETLINQADFNKTFTQTASVNTSSVRENSQEVTISLKKKIKISYSGGNQNPPLSKILSTEFLQRLEWVLELKLFRTCGTFWNKKRYSSEENVFIHMQIMFMKSNVAA